MSDRKCRQRRVRQKRECVRGPVDAASRPRRRDLETHNPQGPQPLRPGWASDRATDRRRRARLVGKGRSEQAEPALPKTVSSARRHWLVSSAASAKSSERASSALRLASGSNASRLGRRHLQPMQHPPQPAIGVFQQRPFSAATGLPPVPGRRSRRAFRRAHSRSIATGKKLEKLNDPFDIQETATRCATSSGARSALPLAAAVVAAML